MKQYLYMIERAYHQGRDAEYRNGVRRSIFNMNLEFDMRDGFPLVTTRKIPYKTTFAEMLWWIGGYTKTADLKRIGGANIWANWESKKGAPLVVPAWGGNKSPEETVVDGLLASINQEVKGVGSIGPMYGYTWRFAPNNGEPAKVKYADCPIYEAIAPDILEMIRARVPETYVDAVVRLWTTRVYDQLWEMISNLKVNPYSSRHRITAYIPEFVPDESIEPSDNVARGKGTLTPCHLLQQYTVTEIDGVKHLSLHLTQSSADILIGSAFNIAQYALLLHLVAKEVGMVPYMFYYNMADAHLYENQLDTLISSGHVTREPRKLPKLVLSDDIDFWNLNLEDIKLEDYDPHPTIKYELSK